MTGDTELLEAQPLQRLQLVTDAALAHLRLDDLLAALLERTQALLEVDTVAILLLDVERGELVARAAVGIEEEVGTIALTGTRGALVVTPDRQAALVVSDLARAPRGKTYEAWVVGAGRPLPAGLFAGGPDRSTVTLTRPVPRGAGIAVSLEPAGGSQRLTGKLLFESRTA